MTLKTSHKGSAAIHTQLTTPVIVIIYRRAEMTKNLVSALRKVKPRHLFVIGDGPKAGVETDRRSVEFARSELDGINWPCRIELNLSDTNLGCTARVKSGLDWAFTHVDEAIILEDDIDATPDFFAWAERMLSLYRNREDIAMFCGHNPLIRWQETSTESCAIPSQRGDVWGWATTADKWNSVQQQALKGPLEEVADDVSRCEFEPVLAALYRGYLAQARRCPLSWDVDWTLRMALSGRRSLVSPVNLIHHLGLGADATHHLDGDSTLFGLPRPTLRMPESLALIDKKSVDRRFDQARVLLELLVRTRNPAIASRLAMASSLPIDAEFRTHLLPFVHRDQMLTVLNHLKAEGLDSSRYQYWSSALHAQPGVGDEL